MQNQRFFSHECISASVILSRKLKSSQQEAQSLLKSLPSFPMFPSDSVGLVSTSSLQEQFIAFSLSKESLEFQSQAKILSNQLSYLLHDIHSSSLLTTLHTLNAKMYNDESCLVEISSYLNAQSTVLMMLIMTYIPVCSIKYFPIEKPPSFEHSQEESSLRYVVWKLLETYFENLKWDENRGYFSSDHQIGFNLFRVNPFILFLSTIYNYSCMQAVMPLLSLATVHSINELVSSMTVIVEDIALIVRFSCFGVAMSSAHYFLRNEITSRAVFS